MIQSSPIELTCAEIEGRMTAFVLSDGTKGTRLIRMDISTGKWNEGYVAIAAPGGIAFDPKAKTILVSSHSDKGVHRIPPSLIGALPWAFVFGDAASIGPLAVDMSGSRVLVADDYSGVVYSFAMVSAKQSKLLQGLGRINSMSIDLQKNLLYIADSGKRTVWVTPLSGLGVKKPDKFVSVSSLKSLTGVAIDLQSRVWVSSLEPARVIVFGPNGKQVAMFQ
jgi:sugar lactone lactonase YvrE